MSLTSGWLFLFLFRFAALSNLSGDLGSFRTHAGPLATILPDLLLWASVVSPSGSPLSSALGLVLGASIFLLNPIISEKQSLSSNKQTSFVKGLGATESRCWNIVFTKKTGDSKTDTKGAVVQCELWSRPCEMRGDPHFAFSTPVENNSHSWASSSVICRFCLTKVTSLIDAKSCSIKGSFFFWPLANAASIMGS